MRDVTYMIYFFFLRRRRRLIWFTSID